LDAAVAAAAEQDMEGPFDVTMTMPTEWHDEMLATSSLCLPASQRNKVLVWMNVGLHPQAWLTLVFESFLLQFQDTL
jgi:hypothetical protein